MASALELSVVIPIYNEAENIRPLQERVRQALDGLGVSHEVIYVDDGSRDDGPRQLLEIARDDPAVVVIRFRRNFGQTAALQAGIDASRGEVVVFMDGDLQNDPNDIGRLLAKLNEGFDLVSGWRRNRQDAFTRRLPSKIANWLISRVTGVHLHDYGCTLKAYRRDVLEPIQLYGEMHRFIPAYAAWAGASIAELEVQHHARRAGKSKYGVSRTMRVLLDLLTVKLLSDYFTKPIYFFGFISGLSFFLSFLALLESVLEKVLPPHTYIHNNPFFLIAIFFALAGLNILMMGLLGEIAIRTYHESQGKPTYVIREVIRGGEPVPRKLPARQKVH